MARPKKDQADLGKAITDQPAPSENTEKILIPAWADESILLPARVTLNEGQALIAMTSDKEVVLLKYHHQLVVYRKKTWNLPYKTLSAGEVYVANVLVETKKIMENASSHITVMSVERVDF